MRRNSHLKGETEGPGRNPHTWAAHTPPHSPAFPRARARLPFLVPRRSWSWTEGLQSNPARCGSAVAQGAVGHGSGADSMRGSLLCLVGGSPQPPCWLRNPHTANARQNKFTGFGGREGVGGLLCWMRTGSGLGGCFFRRAAPAPACLDRREEGRTSERSPT